MCKIEAEFNCKDRDSVYRMVCRGTDRTEKLCSNISYEGETSRSDGERFGEHMGMLMSNCDSSRKKSVFFQHIMEEHENINPKIGLEVIARCPGDATMRQAIEAVSIRENKPVLNGKEEWTNEPRKC